MSSRMDKYYKDEVKEEKNSRTAKNKNIYSEIDDDNYENLNLTSNISIIKSDTDNLNIDDIKKLIDQKYQRPAREIDLEDFEEEEDNNTEDTKEYDLKKIIEAAHKNKAPDYDKERFKRLRETQYEILNSLNVERTGEPELEETLTPDEATLMNLIKTVNENALKSKTMKFNSDDLMGDLLGNDKTEALEPISFEDEEEPDKKTSLVEELEKTKQLSRQEIEDEMSKFTSKLDDVISTLKEIDEEQDDYENEYDDENTSEKTEFSQNNDLANSFYTGQYQIEDKDMDDEFDDLESEINGGNVMIKVLILLLVVIVLAIGVYLLNKYLNLGLF